MSRTLGSSSPGRPCLSGCFAALPSCRSQPPAFGCPSSSGPRRLARVARRPRPGRPALLAAARPPHPTARGGLARHAVKSTARPVMGVARRPHAGARPRLPSSPSSAGRGLWCRPWTDSRGPRCTASTAGPGGSTSLPVGAPRLSVCRRAAAGRGLAGCHLSECCSPCSCSAHSGTPCCGKARPRGSTRTPVAAPPSQAPPGNSGRSEASHGWPLGRICSLSLPAPGSSASSGELCGDPTCRHRRHSQAAGGS